MSPELRSAVAAAEGLLNFYRPLEKLAEVLRVAREAEQLVSERTAQAASLAGQIAEARAELDRVTKAASETIEALDAQKRARQAEINSMVMAADVQRAAAREKFAREMGVARESAESQLATLENSIKLRTGHRDALVAESSKLNAIVEELRGKLKGL